MHPSSTSSSSPDCWHRGAAPADWWRPPVLAVLLVLVAELLCRTVLIQPAELAAFWQPEAGTKLLGYITRAAAGEVDDILIVGDSTAQRGLSPAALVEGLGQDAKVYNLAFDGNFQLALPATTTPLFDGRYPVPPVVVYGGRVARLTESEKSSSERLILGSPYAQKILTGHARFGLGALFLTRMRSFARVAMGHRFTVSGDGFAPLDGVAQPGEQDEEAGPSGPLPPIDPERLQAVLQLIDTVVARGSQFVLVIPPLRSVTEEDYYAPLVETLGTAARQHGASVVALRDVDGLTLDHFKDGSHVNREGARIISLELGRRLARLVADSPRRPDRGGER